MLARYGLAPDGGDLQLSEEKRTQLENSEGAEMREPVRHALKSQRLQTLADFEQVREEEPEKAEEEATVWGGRGETKRVGGKDGSEAESSTGLGGLRNRVGAGLCAVRMREVWGGGEV